MDVLEIDDGLWRWTAFHEEWNEQVGCVYVETEDGRASCRERVSYHV